MHQIVQFFKTFSGGACPRTLLAWLHTFCAQMKILYVLNITPPSNMESWSATEVLSLQCRTFGIQIRLDVLFSMIWVHLLFCRLHHRYYTKFLAADILRLVFLRRIYKPRLSFEIVKAYLRTLVRVD